MRYSFLLFALTLLAACGQNVKERPIDEVNLGDMAILQELGEDLTDDERAALATYVVAHWSGSSAFCGEVLVDQSGQPPETIGDAITMTLYREEERERRLAEAARPRTSMEKLIDRRDFLLGQQNQLYARKTLLFDEYGPEAPDLPQMAAIERELQVSLAETAKLTEEIQAKRAAYFAQSDG